MNKYMYKKTPLNVLNQHLKVLFQSHKYVTLPKKIIA